MLKLEDLKPGLPLVPLESASDATIAAVIPISDGAVQVFYRTPDGTTKERLDCQIVDVSTDKCGWDLTSHATAVEDQHPEPRHIEVKGRLNVAVTITVTRNEMQYVFSQSDTFLLAIVLADADDTYAELSRVRRPFAIEPGWGLSSISFNIRDLLRRSDAGVF
jgi:hypothetical protein